MSAYKLSQFVESQIINDIVSKKIVFLRININNNKPLLYMKKFYILMMAVLLMVMGGMRSTTTAQVIVVTDQNPYFESFEDSTMVGWTQDTLVGSSLWTQSTSQAHSGGKSAYFLDWSAGNETMLISPALDLSGLSGVAKLSFYHLQQRLLLSVTALHVYYRTNVAEDWILLRSFTAADTTFTLDSLYLPANISLVQIGFKGVSASSFSGAYIDDISITTETNCLIPTALTVGNVTSTDAVLTWTPQGAESSWKIEYGPVGFALGTGSQVQASGTPTKTIAPLAPGTAYQAYVQADCGGSTSDWFGPVAFNTPCNAISITDNMPYTEDFSNYTASNAVGTAGPMPGCWDYNFSGSTAGYEPKVFNGTYVPNEGDNALAITSGRSTLFGIITLANAGIDNYVILPEFTNALGELQLIFNTAMSTDTAGVLTLGFMTDPSDPNTFTNICIIQSNNYVIEPSANHVIPLSIYPVCNGTHARLAFRWSDPSTTATSTCCIDDFTARILRSCAEPLTISVDAIAPNSVEVDWTPGSASQNSWEVTCNGVSNIVNAHPYTVTGLTPSTEYTVNVRAICGANDTSYWGTPVTFTTACPVIAVDNNNPFLEGFDDNSLDCWLAEILEAQDNWEIGYSAHTGAYGISYSNSIFGDLMGGGEPSILDILSMFGGMMDFGIGSARLISPILDLTGMTGPVELTFYRRQHSLMIPLTLQVLYRTSPTGTWAYLQQFTGAASDWTREQITLLSPSATYQIAFVSIVDMNNMDDIFGGMDPTTMVDMSSVIDIDDIRVGAPGDCSVPANITVTNVTTNSATITWDAGNAASWNIEYGPNGFIHGNGTQVTANNNIYTLTNLTPGTAYDVYVQGVCAPDNISPWSNVATFSTQNVGIAEYGHTVSIYPNPATSTCTVSCDVAGSEILLYDLCGKQLLRQTMTSHTLELNLSDYADGIYFVRVITDGKMIANSKLVKE